MKIKPKRRSNLSTSLIELQKDRQEIDRCVESPVYFYNRYVRKEGQKVLSEEEYREYVLKAGALREKMKSVGSRDLTSHPLTLKEVAELKTSEDGLDNAST